MDYSPPPWSIRKSGTGRTTIVADDNLEVAFVLRHPDHEMGNAQLIAAAPYLLQALEIIVKESTDSDIVELATLALSKAASRSADA